MRRRDEELPAMPMTSMIDIIFQLLIFFIVILSVMPSVKSAPQVEGSKSMPTPKKGDTEVSMVIQFQKAPEPNRYDFYVLQGNDKSAEFYKAVAGKRNIPATVLRNKGIRYEVYYDQNGLKDLLKEVRDNEPAVLIRAPKNIPYGQVVDITGYMHNLGITKIAWVDGTLGDLKAQIKKTKRRSG